MSILDISYNLLETWFNLLINVLYIYIKNHPTIGDIISNKYIYGVPNMGVPQEMIGGDVQNPQNCISLPLI